MIFVTLNPILVPEITLYVSSLVQVGHVIYVFRTFHSNYMHTITLYVTDCISPPLLLNNMSAIMDLNIDTALAKILERYGEEIELIPMQKAALERIWEGEMSIIVSLPTGYGKSIMYELGG